MANDRDNYIKMMTFTVLVGISIFALVDIIIDVRSNVSLDHILHEAALWFLSMIAAFYQFKIIKWQKIKLYAFEQKIKELDEANTILKLEQEKFRKKISHLSDEFIGLIDEQFSVWNFSRGEKEIALFLIKGLSMKEIADIRGSTESTVRQQASQVYKKSSLAGRMELSAFFLDDLLSISKL